MSKRTFGRGIQLTGMLMIAVLAVTWVASASSVDVAVVDVTVPTNSVTLAPGATAPIVLNMSVSGNQEGTATFEVYRDWVLSGGVFTGINPQEFTVPARNGGDPATTFSTTGTISIAAGQATGTFALRAGAVDITNSNTSGGKLGAGNSSNYSVTVSAPSKAAGSVNINNIPNNAIYGGSFTPEYTKAGDGAASVVSKTTSVCAVDVDTGSVNFVAVGTCTLQASVAESATHFAATGSEQSFAVAKATAAITLDDLVHTYDGTAKSASVTTNPANLTVVTITYDGSTTAPTNAGSYAVEAILDNANYEGSAADTLVIRKAAGSVSIDNLPADAVYGGSFIPTYTKSGDGVASIVSLTQSFCTVDETSGEVSFVGAGECKLQASVAEGTNHLEATGAEQSFTIAMATATITLGNLTHTYDGTAKSASVTTDPPGLGVVTITYEGSAAAPINAGSYEVEAVLNNANYEGSATGTLVIDKASQTITFGALTNKVFGDPSFLISASASSGLPVAFASKTETICTVSGNTVTMLKAGTCTIEATQAGNANYEAAQAVTQSFQVMPWTINGFYNPVTMGGPSVVNTVKGGSTVPLKFNVYAGSTELKTTTAIGATLKANVYTCGGNVTEDPVDLSLEATGNTQLRYDTAEGQFIFNWKTPKDPNKCYAVTISFQDGSKITAYFKLK